MNATPQTTSEVVLFHQIKKETFDKVRAEGVKRGFSGDKRDDAIAQADEFLTQHMPETFKSRGVDRKANIFCYLKDGHDVIDIKTGKKEHPSTINDGADQVLLEISVDPSKCFVGDLDLFDKIKGVLEDNQKEQAEALADTYWSRVQPLTVYRGEFKRPEAMVVCDVAPSAILRSH